MFCFVGFIRKDSENVGTREYKNNNNRRKRVQKNYEKKKVTKYLNK